MSDLNSAISEVETQISAKANQSDMEQGFADVGDQITEINANIALKANQSYVNSELNKKQDKVNIVTQSSPSNIAIADNTEYYLTNVSSLTFTYPSGNFECWIKLQTVASGTVAVSFPNSQYIGKIPTIGSGESWEISIKNGVIIAGQIT